jgi:nitroreductase
MEFFEAVERRVSIRQFTKTPVPAEVIERALDAAILAPNSSNMQTWDFYWVRTPEKKAELVRLCLNQAAARTAQELLVVVADPAQWRRSHAPLVKFVEEVNAPRLVQAYYKQLIPVTYRWGFLNLIGLAKWIGVTAAGLVRPMMRGPATRGQLQEVALKSAALAAENFVLAITAQGFSSCMMEGFDEVRVARLLGLSSSARIPMVIGVGESSARGTWGPRFRLPREQVIHRV